MTHPIPHQAFAQHVVVLGKTRSGKSSTMRGIVESLLAESKPVCIIDPKGDWWGLKSSADGKRAGYPVIIFGGEHADVPLNAHSGAHVAELVATGNRPCIIDLGGWMVSDRTRFFIDFSSTLFRHTRGPRWLVIDEAHNFVPQGKVLDPEAGKMLHWGNRLASEGAGKGLTLISASQRPQKVHKDYLTSHETLIAMRVIHPLDRGAIKDWIDGCPDAAKGKEVLATLASMQRGEGWVWSPEIGFGPERVQFPMFRTYDSFKAPTGEATHKLKGWASVDLEEVRAKLATVVEEAKANDPKELRAEIARLKRDLQKPPAAPVAPDTAAIAEAEQRGYTRGKVDGYSAGVADATDDLAAIRGKVTAAVTAGLDAALHEIATRTADHRARADLLMRPAMLPVQRPRPVPAPTPPASRQPREASGSLPGPEQRILDSVQWWTERGHDRPTNAQVAWLAGYSPAGGSYKNPRGSLKTQGLIDYPEGDRISVTPAGGALARPPVLDRPLIDWVLSRLPGPESRILTAVGAHYPKAASNAVVAADAGYSPDGGSFKNPRGALRSKGLIEYPRPDHLRAADWLFE
jgi:hypothetical protein